MRHEATPPTESATTPVTTTTTANTLSTSSSTATAPAPLPIRPARLELVFSVAAWLKLQFLCHLGDTEIGAFAITPPGHPFFVEDILTIRQSCSAATVEFDDEAVADFFEEQVDQGRTPEQFARIWIHTHPGESPDPSSTDEQTFARVFGRCGWAVMFILARGGAIYCRLKVTAERSGASQAGPAERISISQQIPVRVGYAGLIHSVPHLAVDEWSTEYARNVQVCPGWDWGYGQERRSLRTQRVPTTPEEIDAALDWFDSLEPEEQEIFMEHANAGWEDDRPGWGDDHDDACDREGEVGHEQD
jgi:hypothetical protein